MNLRDNFKQQHFVVYELVLPYCTVCTPISTEETKWHTPLLCQESSDAEYSLWFTSNKSPLQKPPATSINARSKLNSLVSRCVTSGTETTAKLKPGEGLSSRSTMSINFEDFEADPGPIEFTENGTFFGKLQARNVLEGKKLISHYYSITDSQVAPEEVYTATHYISSTNLSGGKFTIQAKDILKDIEAFSQQFPEPTESVLTSDIDNAVTVIPINNTSPYAVGKIIRIDKELMRINSVGGSSVTVDARGSSYVDGNFSYSSDAKQHSSGSTVQLCYSSPNASNANVLFDIFDSIGLADITDLAQWSAELGEWNNGESFVGLYTEPQRADDLINQILTNLMADMWLDQPTQKLRISAVSAWRENVRTVIEGNDLTDLRITSDKDSRFSRSYIYNQKAFKAENDDNANFSKLTIFTDVAGESADFYGSVKVKEFDPSAIITAAAADILTSRYVQRFSRTPKTITFKMEERKIAYKTPEGAPTQMRLGDIVDVISRESQTASGATLQARDRLQIIEIKPDLNKVGRMYSVKGLSYIPLIATDPGQELFIFVSGSVLDLNLYARAGAPNVPINVTYIFDAATIGSTSPTIPAVRAGNFNAGSRVRIICTNNVKWSAIGGLGGNAQVNKQALSATANSGGNGGNSYQSDGIESLIYLNYGTVEGYSTSAELYAAGGGTGGAAIATLAKLTGDFATQNPVSVTVGAVVSGSGGNGIPSGQTGIPSDTGSGSDVKSGLNGSFAIGGGGVFASQAEVKSGGSAPGTPPLIVNCSVTAFSGEGGSSLNPSIDSTTGRSSNANNITEKRISAGSGLAGGAIKGAQVTVYNLAAQSAKLKAGNSDSFTLITA